ncbi:MAG: hypothetical protein KGJ21_02775 [Pseudomonadota bacterium]|nr:hypothetical protein [Pseudomonadota bacterium]
MNDDDKPFPSRWLNRTVEFVFGGFRYQLTVGMYPDGRYGEVTLTGPRSGSALSYIALDSCALVNELLQRYVSIETLTELIQRDSSGGAESIIGEIILQLAQST